MTGWLLDTSVLSAFAPGRATVPAAVAEWVEANTDGLFVPTITAAEICAGIAELRRSGAERRADALQQWFENALDLYADRILPFDLAAARIAGLLIDAAIGAGRHPGFPDIAIAAIARAHGMVVLTRNSRHFEPLGVEVLDSFAM